MDTQRIVSRLVYALLLGGLIYFYIKNNKGDDLNHQIEAYVENLNQQVPIQEDPVTVLDTILLPESKTIRYVYTLSDQLFEGKDIRPEQFRLTMRPIILKNLRKDESLAAFRDAEVTFQFIYKAESGVEMMDFNFDAEEYNDIASEE